MWSPVLGILFSIEEPASNLNCWELFLGVVGESTRDPLRFLPAVLPLFDSHLIGVELTICHSMTLILSIVAFKQNS